MRTRTEKILILITSSLFAFSASAQVASGAEGSGCSTVPDCKRNQVVSECSCRDVCASGLTAITFDENNNLFGCAVEGGVVADSEPLTLPSTSATDPCAGIACAATMRCRGGACVPIPELGNGTSSRFSKVKSPKDKSKNNKNEKRKGKKKKS